MALTEIYCLLILDGLIFIVAPRLSSCKMGNKVDVCLIVDK